MSGITIIKHRSTSLVLNALVYADIRSAIFVVNARIPSKISYFDQHVESTGSVFELHHKVFWSLSKATVIPLTVKPTA